MSLPILCVSVGRLWDEGAGWVCGVREAICRRIEPEIDLVREDLRGVKQISFL